MTTGAREPKQARSLKRLGLLCGLLLLPLLVPSVVKGQTLVQDYTPPYEVADKDLSTIYGRYEIYEADKYRGSVSTTAAEAQAWVGQELIVTATLFKYPSGLRIENPVYKTWFYPHQPSGNVPGRGERWSSFYLGFQGQAPGNDFIGDEIIEVYKPGGTVPDGPWQYLEVIGTNELWVGFDGWYYKARKTTQPVVTPGHADYCRDFGPCSAGQGDCDSDSECQSGLTCQTSGAAPHLCTVPVTLHGYVDVISRLHGPLTLYGWAYNAAASSTSIPVEIYVDGPRGTGTLAATVTADQPRPDVNTVHNITGDHGFEWLIPAQYQSGTHTFYVYALDQTPTPTVRTQLSPASITLRAPGHNDYCQAHGPCVTGQGDCDGDVECQSGLVCVDDVGANYGWSSITDVCEAAVSVGHNDYCRDQGPCSAGQGDCDSDSECASGLTCVHDVGAKYGWSSITDVCEVAVSVGHNDYCRDQGPCSAGQGDCDSDSECASGLTCVHDVGAKYGFSAITDVCEAPS